MMNIHFKSHRSTIFISRSATPDTRMKGLSPFVSNQKAMIKIIPRLFHGRTVTYTPRLDYHRKALGREM